MRSKDATPTGQTTRRDEGGESRVSDLGVAPPPDPPLAVSVTAEIPIVPASVAPDRHRGRDGPASRQGRGRSGRLPAPFTVRAAVWSLVFVLVLALVGLWAIHAHPGWFTFLRNKATRVASPPAATLPGSSGAPSSSSARHLGLVSTSASSATYAVPAGGYSVVLTLSAAHPCDMKVVSPAGSSTVVFESVVQANESPKAVPLSASASVGLAAQAASLSIESGGKSIETIPTPKILPFHYNFEPVGG